MYENLKRILRIKKSNFITSKLSLVAHEVKIKNAKFVKMSADTRLKKIRNFDEIINK